MIQDYKIVEMEHYRDFLTILRRKVLILLQKSKFAKKYYIGSLPTITTTTAAGLAEKKTTDHRIDMGGSSNMNSPDRTIVFSNNTTNTHEDVLVG